MDWKILLTLLTLCLFSSLGVSNLFRITSNKKGVKVMAYIALICNVVWVAPLVYIIWTINLTGAYREQLGLVWMFSNVVLSSLNISIATTMISKYFNYDLGNVKWLITLRRFAIFCVVFFCAILELVFYGVLGLRLQWIIAGLVVVIMSNIAFKVLFKISSKTA